MKKISINMLSSADKVAGQGVGSAYLEQVKLVKEGAGDLFDVYINSRKTCDIVHCHQLYTYEKGQACKCVLCAFFTGYIKWQHSASEIGFCDF